MAEFSEAVPDFYSIENRQRKLNELYDLRKQIDELARKYPLDFNLEDTRKPGYFNVITPIKSYQQLVMYLEETVSLYIQADPNNPPVFGKFHSIKYLRSQFDKVIEEIEKYFSVQ